MRHKTTLHRQLLALKLMPIILLVIGFASAIQLWIHTVDATAKSEHQTAVITSAQALNGEDPVSRAVQQPLSAEPAAAQQLATLVADDC
jgi:hypothetical protein